MLNFNTLVLEELILLETTFDPTKNNVYNVLFTHFQREYRGKPTDYDLIIGKNVSTPSTVQNIVAGGAKYLTSSDLREKRVFFPLIDTGAKIYRAINNPTTYYEIIKNGALELNTFVTSTSSSSTLKKINSNSLDVIVESIEYFLNTLPGSYKITEPRLLKVLEDLGRLTIEQHLNKTILQSVLDIAKLHEQNVPVVQNVLLYPVDYITGKSSVPTNFEREILVIASKLVDYYKNVIKNSIKTAPSPDVIKVGTLDGVKNKDKYALDYVDFLNGKSTSWPGTIVRTLADLEGKDPNTFETIKEWSQYIKKEDKLAKTVSALGQLGQTLGSNFGNFFKPL
jgi:hypothetical protein